MVFKGSVGTFFIQIFATLNISAASESNEVLEWINQNNFTVTEMGLATVLGRIDGCKVTTERIDDDEPYKFWLGADDYFTEALEPYYVLAKLMSDSANDKYPNSIDVSYFNRDGITKSPTYQKRFQELKGSDDCLKFGDGSVYDNLAIVHSFVYESAKITWKKFNVFFPIEAKKIKLGIQQVFPKNFIFN